MVSWPAGYGRQESWQEWQFYNFNNNYLEEASLEVHFALEAAGMSRKSIKTR